MDRKKIGGGLLAAIGSLGPSIADGMNLAIPTDVGKCLLAACLVSIVIGLILVFWPDRRPYHNAEGPTARALPPRFIGLVSGAVDPVVKVQIRTEDPSTEAIEFGKQLEGSLIAAGWAVTNFGTSLGGKSFRGTRIEVANPQSANSAAARLCQALNQVGVPAEVFRSGIEAWGPNVIRVSIGAFPE